MVTAPYTRVCRIRLQKVPPALSVRMMALGHQQIFTVDVSLPLVLTSKKQDIALIG